MTNISLGASHVAYSMQGVGSCEGRRGSSLVTQCQAAGNSFAALLVQSSDCLVGSLAVSPQCTAHSSRRTDKSDGGD